MKKLYILQKFKHVLICLHILLLLSSAAKAQLIAYEGFDYSDGTSVTTGTPGGLGWNTNWTGPGADNRAATASPLLYTGLSITGNYMSHTTYSE